MFPSKVVNVFIDRFHYELHLKDNQCIKWVLNPGVYNSITLLFVKMRRAYHRAIDNKEANQLVNFKYSCHGRITYTYETADIIALKFSNDLAIMLGFESNEEYT